MTSLLLFTIRQRAHWVLSLALSLFVGTLFAEESSPVEMLIDGKVVASTPEGFQVPASHQSVSFRLGKSAEDNRENNRRMRFKLEGVDSAWRQISSEMCLMVRFADAAGDQVGQRLFLVERSSPGWRGTMEDSTFTQRRETVRVPEGCSLLTAAISSSGPPTAMGIYVVQNLKILRATPHGAEAVLEVRSGHPVQGWTRSGTRPSMAKMVTVAGGEAFCILDDDPGAHAEWNIPRNAALRVQPGEMLTVEWSEMYDIGMANRFDVNYGRLNAGSFRFLTNELETTGAPLVGQRVFEFTVLQPFWKSAWFWVACIALAGTLLWLGGRALFRVKIRQHMARVEQEHAIVRERLRIARDLHDDLGVRLTHISLVSGLAENESANTEARESFHRISGMARELVAALYQTVWTVNPENDHLEAVANFLCQLTENVCETAGIRCRIHSGNVPSGRRVRSEVRHNITLAVKEALNNAIKHAAATEITVRMEFADPHLQITIADNGRGYDPGTIEPGCGLENMRRRMTELGGDVAFETSAGAGTRIRFAVPVPAEDSDDVS